MLTLLFRTAQLLLAVALLLHANPTQAQIVGNGGFDNSNVNCSNKDSHFYAGCVPFWRASHGSPQIKGSGDLYAYMWSQSGKGEGIFTQLTGLSANTTYELAFTIRGYNNPLLAVKVATGMVGAGTGAPDGGNIPTYNAVWSQRYYPSPTWTQYTVRITVPSNGNYQLWIYPETAAADHTHYDVYVNDVSFDPVGCLTRDVFYQNTNSLPILAKTQGSIFAGQAVTNLQGYGPVSVLSGQSVTFVAGQQISLQEGFSAQPDSYFEAVTGGGNSCAVSRTSQTDDWWTASATGPTSSHDSTATASSQQASSQRTASQPQSSDAVYPNPAADQLTITAQPTEDGSKPQQATIVNSYGIEVKHIKLRDGSTTISIKELPRGMYYLRTQGKDHVNTIRFTIER